MDAMYDHKKATPYTPALYAKGGIFCARAPMRTCVMKQYITMKNVPNSATMSPLRLVVGSPSLPAVHRRKASPVEAIANDNITNQNTWRLYILIRTTHIAPSKLSINNAWATVVNSRLQTQNMNHKDMTIPFSTIFIHICFHMSNQRGFSMIQSRALRNS